jgi:hypothetical protein
MAIDTDNPAAVPAGPTGTPPSPAAAGPTPARTAPAPAPPREQAPGLTSPSPTRLRRNQRAAAAVRREPLPMVFRS